MSSPGSLPKGLTLADPGRKSVRRNALVSDLLHRIDFVEKAGTGIRRIRDEARAQDCPEPQFEANSFATCCSSRVSCLFRARRGELFAAGAGPRPPPSHPGEPRATICALLLVQDPQHQTAAARA